MKTRYVTMNLFKALMLVFALLPWLGTAEAACNGFVCPGGGTGFNDNTGTYVDISMSLTSSATTLPADGVSTVSIQATLVSGYGPVVGQSVTFTATSGTLSNTSAATNSAGVAEVTLTASEEVGTVRVTAFYRDASYSTYAYVWQQYLYIDFVSNTVENITVTAGSDEVIADGQSTSLIQATVYNGDFDPLSGVPVTFTTTAGTLSATSADTNNVGVASVSLTAPTTIGSAIVYASASGIAGSDTVAFVAGPPKTMSLVVNPSAVTTGETSSVYARVYDQYRNPVEGASVLFDLFTSGKLAAMSSRGADLSAALETTDAAGKTGVITYTAGTQAGKDFILAKTANGVTGYKPITVTGGGNTVDGVELWVSSPQLNSSGSPEVTLTALVRDANNNTMDGVDVTFSSSASSGVDPGVITVSSGTTGASGTATATLGTAGDPTNRTITVAAAAGSKTAQESVEVTGTTLSVDGPSSVTQGGVATLTIYLKDSDGNGISGKTLSISSALGNPISASTLVTDSSGRVTVKVTATAGGTGNPDTITVSALNATGTYSLAVSDADIFAMTAPVSGAEITLGTCEPITVSWTDISGIPQVGEALTIAATRGALYLNATCTIASDGSATTGATGTATRYITASNAGPSVITASGTASDGPTDELEVEFVATTPASMTLQADPTLIGVNTAGSEANQASIVAVVRDADNNLVKSKTVLFTLTDVTGGSLSNGSAVTDSFGRASTVYIAGTTSSAANGVRVDAKVQGTAVAASVQFTVSTKGVFITLGTGNQIEEPNTTTYRYPYSVLVTDSAGGPVANAEVALSVVPTAYYKGSYAWNGTLWVTTPPTGPCYNEDLDLNGIYDASVDNDENANGLLEPGNVVTIDIDAAYVVTSTPPVAKTDSSGFAYFYITYAQEYANWIDVDLTARATVAGSESSNTASFNLDGLASDFTQETVSPPGFYSPYGTARRCGNPN